MSEHPSAADRAVYVISVVADLAGMHPQTLRMYERKGLLEPKRTAGNSRRYSQADLDQLVRIQELTQAGVNLAGVSVILDLEDKLERAQQRLAAANRRLAEMQKDLAERNWMSGRAFPVRLSDVRNIFERR